MPEENQSEFLAKVLQPKKHDDAFEAFIILPNEVSSRLSRRGRTTVDLVVSSYKFQVTLEPDGNMSHWAKLTNSDLELGKMNVGSEYAFTLIPVACEPEPSVPADLSDAIQQLPNALKTWKATTIIARVDWIHWVESAKQAKTRVKRIADACSMLAEGKARVCCFDNSGFYSKALKSPKV